jgi:hypothetical protein
VQAIGTEFAVVPQEGVDLAVEQIWMLPVRKGHKLYASARSPRKFIKRFRGARHNDLMGSVKGYFTKTGAFVGLITPNSPEPV